ncbi:hypothetical protein [Roseibacillus persicicus]|uniref:hypothetical protein n=1 Tax=Roseibacillus persicicus TaxID=454148 RepID=UPI0028104357|nr:hypothetical protein [Roseibacillus persicicus]MDQ8189846.1 hypothetical protein [Roseibacillus persicicus]
MDEIIMYLAAAGIWMIPVVILMWLGDNHFDKDPRWIFLWGFIFGPIGALVTILVLRPRGEQEPSANQRIEALERREKARKIMERGTKKARKQASTSERNESQNSYEL